MPEENPRSESQLFLLASIFPPILFWGVIIICSTLDIRPPEWVFIILLPPIFLGGPTLVIWGIYRLVTGRRSGILALLLGMAYLLLTALLMLA